MTSVENPESYLDKKLEPETELSEGKEEKQLEDIRGILANFPSVSENQSRPKEPGEYQFGDFKLCFGFSDLNLNEFYLDETIDSLAKKMFHYTQKTDKTDITEERKLFWTTELLNMVVLKDNEDIEDMKLETYGNQKVSDLIKQVKILNQFSIKNIHSQEKIDLATLLPDGFEIIYIPSNKVDGYTEEKHKKILLSGDITALDTILVLLHEIGHLQTNLKMNKKEKNQYLKIVKKVNEKLQHKKDIELTKNELAVFLKGERDAFAFTLSQIKKIFPIAGRKKYSSIIQTAKDYIHKDALKTKSKILIDMQNPKYKNELNNLAEELGFSSEEFDEMFKEIFSDPNSENETIK